MFPISLRILLWATTFFLKKNMTLTSVSVAGVDGDAVMFHEKEINAGALLTNL